jgi:hypothetical protein
VARAIGREPLNRGSDQAQRAAWCLQAVRQSVTQQTTSPRWQTAMKNVGKSIVKGLSPKRLAMTGARRERPFGDKR